MPSFLSIATLFLLGSHNLGLAIPTSASDLDVVVEGPNPIDLALEENQTIRAAIEGNTGDTFSAQTECVSGSNINTADIENLYNWLYAQPGDMYLPGGSTKCFTLGSARISISNWYWFENTHVKFWEGGWGGNRVKDECCHTPFCGGGWETGHGDTGLEVRIAVDQAGGSC